MGKTVNVPYFNRDTVEYAPRERDDRIKTRDQNTASFSEKHYGREPFGEFNFQDVIVALDALLICWLQLVYRDSETIEGVILADFR